MWAWAIVGQCSNFKNSSNTEHVQNLRHVAQINTRHFTCLDTPASGYKPLPASAALPTRNRSSHSHYCIPIHVFQRSYSRGHRRRRRIGQDVRIGFIRIKKVQWFTCGGSVIHSSSLREAQMSSSTTLTPLLPKRW